MLNLVVKNLEQMYKAHMSVLGGMDLRIDPYQL